jgi:modulator of FtsH protease
MTAYDPAHWSDFALAQLGASAALLGLVFVALSINLREFVNVGALVHRAAESVVLLASVLLGSTAVLIPDQSATAVGLELAVVAVATSLSVIAFQRDIRKPSPGRPSPPSSAIVIRRVFGLGATLLLMVGAATLLADGGGGLYWWAAAVVASYTSALSNAWVLLIEILR